MKADLIIAQRQNGRMVSELTLYEAIKYGKKVIYEIDDNLDAVLPSSPVFGVYHQGREELKAIPEIMKRCHGVTVSTEELATHYSGYNPNIETVPNSIDFGIRDWESVPLDKDTEHVVVGWSGGSTHTEDLSLIVEPMVEILLKYPKVRMGVYTSFELTRWLVENIAAKFGIRNKEFDIARILYIPPRNFREHPFGLGYFDISLAPIVGGRFNVAKSPLKILEAGAKGIPSVASKVAPYAKLVTDGENGYLAESPRDWVDKISALVEDEERRRWMGDNIRKTVREDYNLDINYSKWYDAWTTLLTRNAKGETPPETTGASYGKVGRNDKCPCGSGKKYKACCSPAWG
jgi:glycosyltransferase involved in cell wall biosynthesis